MKNEIWKRNLKFPDYAVSNFGRVKSFKFKRETILKTPPMKNGYSQVSLFEKGRTKKYYVHRLVWETFVGEIPETLEINHVNGKKRCNLLSNLELVTTKQNSHHALSLGLLNLGVELPWAVLTEKQIKEIRAIYAQGGITQKQIAINYGVAQTTISAITRRKNWAHLA